MRKYCSCKHPFKNLKLISKSNKFTFKLVEANHLQRIWTFSFSWYLLFQTNSWSYLWPLLCQKTRVSRLLRPYQAKRSEILINFWVTSITPPVSVLNVEQNMPPWVLAAGCTPAQSFHSDIKGVCTESLATLHFKYNTKKLGFLQMVTTVWNFSQNMFCQAYHHKKFSVQSTVTSAKEIQMQNKPGIPACQLVCTTIKRFNNTHNISMMCNECLNQRYSQ